MDERMDRETYEQMHLCMARPLKQNCKIKVHVKACFNVLDRAEKVRHVVKFILLSVSLQNFSPPCPGDQNLELSPEQETREDPSVGTLVPLTAPEHKLSFLLHLHCKK